MGVLEFFLIKIKLRGKQSFFTITSKKKIRNGKKTDFFNFRWMLSAEMFCLLKYKMPICSHWYLHIGICLFMKSI